MPDYVDVPPEALAKLASICLSLPEAYQEPSWAGTRWRIRKRTFAHVLSIENPFGTVTRLTFRSAGDELEVLKRAGHPFFRPGWGTDVVGMVLDQGTDWDEVRELITESYCVMAPKKLSTLVDRPDV